MNGSRHRGRTFLPTEPLRFSIHFKTIAMLDKIAETGLYGRDRGDVVRTFIMEGIRRAKLEDPEIFAKTWEKIT